MNTSTENSIRFPRLLISDARADEMSEFISDHNLDHSYEGVNMVLVDREVGAKAYYEMEAYESATTFRRVN